MSARISSSPTGDLFDLASGQQTESATDPNVGLRESRLLAAAPDAAEVPAVEDSSQYCDSIPSQMPASRGVNKASIDASKPNSKRARVKIAQKGLTPRSADFKPSSKIAPGVDFGQAPTERYMSVRQVASRYDVGISTIWRWALEDDRFPAPLRLSKGITRWLESELRSFEALRRTSK